jgi:hypothetical protein
MGIGRYLYKAVWDPLLIRCLDGNGMVLVKPLSNLCDYFVPLCAFVIILCDIFKYNLIGVVLTNNFNFRK